MRRRDKAHRKFSKVHRKVNELCEENDDVGGDLFKMFLNGGVQTAREVQFDVLLHLEGPLDLFQCD